MASVLTVSRRGGPPESGGPDGGRSAGSQQFVRLGWAPAEELDLAEWSSVGRRLGHVGRCNQWWLGDWINYGNARFGERYTRAAKLTGYDVQSLMNMVYVASRFEISRRRENLSWSHHAALAALDEASQELWLERAATDRLSVADLRVELRTQRRALEPPAAPSTPSAHAEEPTIVCPNCGESLPLAH